MQELKSDNKLDIVETLSVIGSIGGAIASLVSTKLPCFYSSICVCGAKSAEPQAALDVRIIKLRSPRLYARIKTPEQVGTLASTNSVTATNYQKEWGNSGSVGTLTQQLAQLQQLTTGLGSSQVII